jgi:uncharacterized protein (TIGR02302 family)
VNRPNEVERLLHRLAGRRAQARAAILFERVWPAIWPALGVAGLFVVVALLDIPRMLPAWAHLALLLCTVLLVGFLLWRGLSRIRRPDDAAADRRLETASGLRHRPLSVLTDRPAHADAAGDALWTVHVRRALGQIGKLRVGRPSPGLARRDRRALRGGLIVALVAAAVIAGPDAPARMAQAFEPNLPRAGAEPATEVQAWITPPAYTGLAPVFLHPEGGNVTVPAGGHLTVSVTGGTGMPSLTVPGGAAETQTVPFRALDAASFQADRDLNAGGRLAVRRDGQELAAWDVTVIADRPPTADWAEPPGQSPRSLQLRLPWAVSDDYGVVGLQAELHLAERPDAPPLVIAIPVPGGTTKSAKGVSLQDLTAHPWAGLKVIGRLVARDAPGQTGASQDAEFVMPERDFQNPLARLLIAVRKGLSLHPDDRNAALEQLDPALATPEAMAGDYGGYLNLAGIYYQLEFDQSEAAVTDAQDRLWQLALHLEEGQTDRTARALDEAREAAREALDKAMANPTPENRADFDKKLQELKEAIQRHMDALADEAKRSNDEMPYDQNAQRLDEQAMQDKADAARDAARDGRMDDAKQQMAELEQMLEQLKNARAERGADEQRNAEKRQRGRQQMGAVQDMITRQGQLLDHAQGRTDPGGDGQQRPMPPSEPQAGAQGAQAGDDAARDADRQVQKALRRALGELMQQFGDLTGQVPDSLGDADKAMQGATDALGKGEDRTAGADEQAAIAALQKGGRQMGQAMAKQFGPPQPGEGNGDGDDPFGTNGMSLRDGRGDGTGRYPRQGSVDRGEGRDPLGRRYGNGTNGADESADVTVPDERERQRTQAIQEELRRRGAERDRPQEELDYIDRLLKQF